LSRGFSQDESEALLHKSVELALEARDIYLKKCSQKRQILIAASVGSYGAYLADGSEYRYSLNVRYMSLNNCTVEIYFQHMIISNF
jgi:S-methylmethionine-dependent homocysteine/selenocysteine methylase